MPQSVLVNGKRYETRVVARRPDHLILAINGRERKIELFSEQGEPRFGAEIDDEPIEFASASDAETVFLRGHGVTLSAKVGDTFSAERETSAAADEIRAPMPGSVVEVRASAGDAVKRGDVVLVIESMKLQTNLAAPRDGVIAELLVGAGDTFGKDAAVARLEAEGEGE